MGFPCFRLSSRQALFTRGIRLRRLVGQECPTHTDSAHFTIGLALTGAQPCTQPYIVNTERE
jgi:hypothetical protein